jgi:FUN14 domain-containing protein 1
MASPAVKKSEIEEANDSIIDEISNDTKGFIDRVLGDVGKSSSTIQLLLGSISGWFTGLITMKVGKSLAFAVGGGIILFQIAIHKGYIKVNWDKIHKKFDNVEEKATVQSPKWMEKVGAFARKNTCAAAAFVGWFFLGLASS